MYGTMNSRPWGHITADGTIANMESMWYAYVMSYDTVVTASQLLQIDDVLNSVGRVRCTCCFVNVMLTQVISSKS